MNEGQILEKIDSLYTELRFLENSLKAKKAHLTQIQNGTYDVNVVKARLVKATVAGSQARKVKRNLFRETLIGIVANGCTSYDNLANHLNKLSSPLKTPWTAHKARWWVIKINADEPNSLLSDFISQVKWRKASAFRKNARENQMKGRKTYTQKAKHFRASIYNMICDYDPTLLHRPTQAARFLTERGVIAFESTKWTASKVCRMVGDHEREMEN